MEEDEAPLLIEDETPLERDDDDATVTLQVPVTIITGFLGAGKSTLLTRILHEKHGKRIAVIQNELGIETGAEKAMVVSEKGDQNQEWLELPNGCICCSVRGDFVAALENLVTNKKNKFDYLFIELDGLAEPGPVAAQLWMDELLESALYLDSIITVVDAKHLPLHLHPASSSSSSSTISSPALHSHSQSTKETKTEAERQIGFADRIILNKMDLVGPDRIDDIVLDIRSINTLAPILKAEMCSVPIDQLLNIRAFDVNKMESMPDSELKVTTSCKSSECTSKDHQHHHLGEVGTIALVEEGNVRDLKELELWICRWAWAQRELKESQLKDKASGQEESSSPTTSKAATELFRYKGVISVKDHPNVFVLQGVHELFEIQSTTQQWRTGERKNKLVFIGKNVDEKELRSSFCSLLDRQSAVTPQ